MAANNQRRIAKELEECTKNPPEGCKVRLVSEADLFHWEVLMDGPKQSVYAVRSPA
jgi:ubiquitin-protein ligase